MYRIVQSIRRPSGDLIKRFRGIKLEILAMLPGAKLCDPAIKPIEQRGWRFAGPAITVAPEEIDGLMAVAAVSIAQPGDVIVIAARGDIGMAAWGGGLTRSAVVKGCAAAVVDGATIDTSSMLDAGLPVFCRARTLAHQLSKAPGFVNIPVQFGGVEVNPGDLVVGDDDGIVVLPAGQLEALIGPAEAKQAQIAINANRIAEEGITLFELKGGRAPFDALGIVWV
jgi:4-hydroxy-4-methyl-2-oxoglutarate aldolase